MNGVLDTFSFCDKSRAAAGLAAGILAVLLMVLPARAEDRDCPSHPEATYALQGDPDAQRSQLSQLAEPAKRKGAVCIAAYYDAQGPANSKKLALRRADWVMRQLIDKGVPDGIISRSMRGADKSTASLVVIVLGP